MGEEEVGAAEDEAAGLGGGSGDVGGEEAKDGGDVGRADGGGEEGGGCGGEAGDVGIGEGLGFEEVEGGEDVAEGVGVGEGEGVVVGWDYGEVLEVSEVLAVRCTELDVEGFGVEVEVVSGGSVIGGVRRRGWWEVEGEEHFCLGVFAG